MARLTHVEEYNYPDYQQRQYDQITPDAIRQGTQKARYSGKFLFENGRWQPQPYRGYAIVSMVNHSHLNGPLINRLRDIQSNLLHHTRIHDAFFSLPPDSYHQTIANTLSGVRFQENIASKGLEQTYPDIIQQRFKEMTLNKKNTPISMKMIGLSCFGGSLGVLGVFEQQEDFETIIGFRDLFYNDQTLNQYGIRRTRPFIGHITLAYFGRSLVQSESEELAETMSAINQEIKRHPLYFVMNNTELRSYHNLSRFDSAPEYPVYSFTTKTTHA